MYAIAKIQLKKVNFGAHFLCSSPTLCKCRLRGVKLDFVGALIHFWTSNLAQTRRSQTGVFRVLGDVAKVGRFGRVLDRFLTPCEILQGKTKHQMMGQQSLSNQHMEFGILSFLNSATKVEK